MRQSEESMIIGLTGGIGSGKSTAAECFRKLGLITLDADRFSREALDPGTDCYAKTIQLFGKECLKTDGTIDRAYVAGKVFSDENLRNRLNGIIHPYVLERMLTESRLASANHVIWEVPLLFESGFDAYCDRTVAVLCRDEIRIERICRRDHMTRTQALSRIRAQISDEERMKRADDYLWNEGEEQQLMHSVAALVQKWKKNG